MTLRTEYPGRSFRPRVDVSAGMRCLKVYSGLYLSCMVPLALLEYLQGTSSRDEQTT